MLDMRLFQNFIKVIELGSLSRAADAVGLTQPALSQQLASLESYFGVQLLHRVPKGVVPTDYGLVLQSRFEAILGQIAAARDDLASSDLMPIGTVAISLPNSVAEIVSIPLLESTQQRFPEIELQISALPNRLILDHLLHNRVDMAIMFGTNFGKGVRSHAIGDESLFFLTSPGSPLSLNTGVIDPAELHGQQIVLPCSPHQVRSMVEEYFSTHGIKVDIVAQIDSLSNLIHLASAGPYGTILPWSAIYRGVSAGIVIARPLPETMQRTLSLCVSQHVPLSRAGAAVLDLLVANIHSLVECGRWRGIQLCKTTDSAHD